MSANAAIRQPAVAGTFYSANPEALKQSVGEMLAAARVPADTPCPKAIIAPHAGHMFSGPVAASVYARLESGKDTITRVVLLGPSHRVGFRGIAATTAGTYRTPLGDIPLDTGAIAGVAEMPGAGYLDQAHLREHSLEVHLPFLQLMLGDFQLVPLVVGDAPKEDVSAVLEALWGGPETLIVISSDLSHYHGYEEARQLDARTSDKIVHLNANLSGEEACGCRPINGLLHLASGRGLKVEQLDVRNSGDTAGPRDQVVGYGAFMILQPADRTERTEEASTSLGKPFRQRLIQAARESVFCALTSREFPLRLAEFPEPLTRERASFVTLNRQGQLRGCIGSLTAYQPLVSDVTHNARAAAFKDPRFRPLTLDEYHDVEIHISVLSAPEPMDVDSREDLLRTIRAGIDGLVIEEGSRRATYLPSVWEQLPDPETFVTELRRKAGLSPDGWSPSTRVFRYTTEEFS